MSFDDTFKTPLFHKELISLCLDETVATGIDCRTLDQIRQSAASLYDLAIRAQADAAHSAMAVVRIRIRYEDQIEELKGTQKAEALGVKP